MLSVELHLAIRTVTGRQLLVCTELLVSTTKAMPSHQPAWPEA